MATLTLKQVPDELLDRLRETATRQRRSVNQQAILMLERALVQQRPSFSDALNEFYRVHGHPDEETGAALSNLRSKDSGREVDL